MSEISVLAGAAPDRRRPLAARLRAAVMRSESLRGYTLLSPTLVVMAVCMCVPFAMMVAMSFWTEYPNANLREDPKNPCRAGGRGRCPGGIARPHQTVLGRLLHTPLL